MALRRHVRFCSLIAAAMLGLILPLSAQEQRIPALAPLNDPLATAYPNLASARARLSGERDQLRARVLSQQSRCSAVRENSAADVACLAERNSLAAEVGQHIGATRSFNDDVARATREQLGSLCRALDEERAAMHELNWKVVIMEVENLATVLRLWSGVKDSDGDEPADEDLPRDLREHLGRIARITEDIDQINGKAAWTAQQREWVLQHIYLARPSQQFDVDVSNATAHGQTDFSTLQKMPKFAGCERDPKGTLYVPRYPRP